jgi:hypothetical protein
MKGFLLGLLVAGSLSAAIRTGSSAAAARREPIADAARPSRRPRRRRRSGAAARCARAQRRRSGRARTGGRGRPRRGFEEPEPIKLSAADLKLVSQGDDLSRPDVLRLDMTDDSGSHELSQDEIDARFRAKEDAILGCIQRARPDEETWVPGRVTVKFRIQRTGNVRGVRVEAPAILQKGGIYGCIKGVVLGIRFPPSNGSQVITYPFSLT